jgi:cholesterol transport system auxiliary component
MIKLPLTQPTPATMLCAMPHAMLLRLLLPLLLALLPACSSLLAPVPVAPLARYALDDITPTTQAAAATPSATPGTATLLINLPHAAAGYDTAHMLYVRQPHQLEYFAQNEWVDTPARMLWPLITGTLARSGLFAAVLPAPDGVQGQYLLDVELVRLQHEFLQQPSQVHLTVRAYLHDSTRLQVLAWREFDVTVAAPSDNPYGGVLAANQAVQAMLDQLTAFCRETIPPTPAKPGAG